MKPVISSIAIAFFIVGLAGCNNQPAPLSQDDSSAVANAFVKSHPQARDSFYKPDQKFVATKLRVSKDSCDAMRHAYDSVTTFHIPNPYGGWTTGFNIDTADFNDIVSLAKAGKLWTVGFHFGIRNFNEFAQGAKPIYTMEVVPVGVKWVVFPEGLRRMAGSLTGPATTYGYDFVDPCPGGLGCPPAGK
jgi:hypothetical protein